MTEDMKSSLSAEEYHKIHMLSQEQFDKLPLDKQEAYAMTHNRYFGGRMEDMKPDAIQTADGMTYEEKLDYYRRMKTQTPEAK